MQEYENIIQPLQRKQRWLRFLPLAANIPVLVIFSYAIRSALALPGSPFATESMLWINNLGSVDVGIAIVGALVTFQNAEMQTIKSEKMLDREEAAAAELQKQLDERDRLAGVRRSAEEEQRQRRREMMRPPPVRKTTGKVALPTKASKAAEARRAREAQAAAPPPEPAPKTEQETGVTAGFKSLVKADREERKKLAKMGWLGAMEAITKKLSPAYTTWRFAQASRIYGAGFFFMASLVVPSVSGRCCSR